MKQTNEKLYRITESFYLTSNSEHVDEAVKSFVRLYVTDLNETELEMLVNKTKYTSTLGRGIWKVGDRFILRVTDRVKGYDIEVVELVN